jgi:hypothetical protein
VSTAAASPEAEPLLWINRESTRWLWVLARMIDTNSDTKAFVDPAAELHDWSRYWSCCFRERAPND